MFVALLLRIARGELDALHGRFLRAKDDVDALLGAAQDPAAGTLRLHPWGG